MSPNETLFLESTNKIYKDDISSTSFVNFQIWDFPGQVDFFDPTFDSEMVFKGTGALIFVIDAQVGGRQLHCRIHYLCPVLLNNSISCVGFFSPLLGWLRRGSGAVTSDGISGLQSESRHQLWGVHPQSRRSVRRPQNRNTKRHPPEGQRWSGRCQPGEASPQVSVVSSLTRFKQQKSGSQTQVNEQLNQFSGSRW